MKVNILGTEYKIIKDAKAEDYPKLKRCDGFTDPTLKLIVIAKYEKDDMTVENLDYYSKKVLRHELVHAFLYESGLDCNSEWARNEEIIDWIAIQFEKMLNVFIETKAIEPKKLYCDINFGSNRPIKTSTLGGGG